jgi:pilus assembly protein Flp/PilA
MRYLKFFFLEEEAATAVEYAVVLAMILMTLIGAISMVGSQAGGMWAGIVSNFHAVGF